MLPLLLHICKKAGNTTDFICCWPKIYGLFQFHSVWNA